jgi:hypothetical protein
MRVGRDKYLIDNGGGVFAIGSFDNTHVRGSFSLISITQAQGNVQEGKDNGKLIICRITRCRVGEMAARLWLFIRLLAC